MAHKTNRKRNDLADRFELEETFLSSPSAAALKSAVLRAVDRASGDAVIVKYWEKTNSAVDADLREIWRHEMRQNERVRAFPRADEVIVDILDSGETDDAFYVVMPGDFAPLEHAARFVRPGSWLRTLHGPRQRVILWQNLRRMAEALGAVHGQGLVHGRIDIRSIYTAGAATEADFRLGGFEFCLRMAELDKAPLSLIGRSGRGVIFSFLDDWRGLGRVIAELIGLDPARLDHEDSQFAKDRAPIDLRPSEIDLVRLLIEPERNRTLDAQIAIERVDSVLGELESEALANNGRFVLALRFGRTSRLSAALNAASGDAFDVDEAAEQMDFVEADLESGVALARTGRGDMQLLTANLAYELKPLRTAEYDETWNVAVCTNARPRDDVRLGRRQDVTLSANRIELVHLGAAARRLQELRTDALDWTGAFDKKDEVDPTLVVRRGLLLVQICEALFKISEIAPVELVLQPARGGKRFVELAPSDSEGKIRLAAALKVDDPHKLLRRLFEREEADLDAEWQLTESAGLGSSSRATASVRFSRVLHKENRRLYEFEVTDGVVPTSAELYLRRIDDSGNEQVLRRRLRMLGALATQSELAAMLADPRAKIRTYRNEALKEDCHFKELDESKRKALLAAWSTGPGQFVVGPPGVGKTKLVTEIVRRVLEGDPTARLLLSAQAHQALDHLAAAVQRTLKDSGLAGDPILVRSRADRGAHLSGAQTPERAKGYLTAMLGSELVRSAPPAIRNSLQDMKKAADVRGDLRARLPIPTLRQRRSFEALVLQSANILFSTTNSGDLERLIEDRAQFDWTIIEEAAKATGPELLAPQLLSMRRLLIGDHNQLPPFDTDRLATLLENQSRVKSALAESDLVVGNIFRDFGLDDLREAVDDDAILSETCAAARRLLLLFESLVTQELGRQKRSAPGRRRVATELLQQHRMHPVIADVISEVFYDGRLETDPGRAAEFETEEAPFAISGTQLSRSPLVFIDLPYVQREGAAGERLPTYHNPAEIEAVLTVLGMIRGVPNAKGEDATLAVLSPYNRQVERLGRAIADRHLTEVSKLNGFRPAAHSMEFENTIDSFQGSEADVVVVSLVRNNDHVGRAALGILRDRRRMNVLLSRAKWKLVIVGSLEFLRVQGRRYSRHRQGIPGGPVHLTKLLEVFDRLAGDTLKDGTTPKLTVVPWANLSGGPS